ncbi:FAD:protein FMN transferase [Undibacterium sp. Xuan67W]|uniref:FAD:protein FMN transferase n=1 Tax=Undibacterium sp. Xuan67W TaxID=3413057 RepID=UPI003BF324DB
MPVFDVAFDAMSSRCEIRLAAIDELAANQIAQSAIKEIKRIEYKYSRYRADSVVTHINAAAGKKWMQCDEETLALFSYANDIYLLSDGLFDITSGILRNAWNFRSTEIPKADVISALIKRIGWGKVKQERQSIYLPEVGMEVDFGGFGKEYAADRAAGILIKQGVKHGYVNLGGDMRFIGPQPDEQPWLIGIQDPRDAHRTVATLPVSRGALATSGDYERFFELDGKRYCHILDPRSGMPVSHWRSVSVLAPLAIAAGSCTTIAMLKQEKGLEFLEDSKMSYLAIDQQGKIFSRNT